METAVLLVLSLLSCFVGFALEVANGNIRHVQNGRTPNAGAALMPNIPLVPLCYLGAAWVADHLRPDIGFEIVAAWALVSIPWRWVLYRRASARLRTLLEENRAA